MMSREDLENKTLTELKRIAAFYGVAPIGDIGNKESWIKALVSFPGAAIDQLRDGNGLRFPEPYRIHDLLSQASDLLGSPTDSQIALIRATVRGEKMRDNIDQYYQERLFTLWLAKKLIQDAVRLL
ncbi:hypothetical protein [Fischerella sp. PCC 9605]|uniref:hypothetical protein n=1 Tax=Fischerella sp. PCC 9605 TaxID=1173024 RepID=UPI00047E1E4F|nr:hypothetical protein [Fischerella sp. PCC 9605]